MNKSNNNVFLNLKFSELKFDSIQEKYLKEIQTIYKKINDISVENKFKPVNNKLLDIYTGNQNNQTKIKRREHKLFFDKEVLNLSVKGNEDKRKMALKITKLQKAFKKEDSPFNENSFFLQNTAFFNRQVFLNKSVSSVLKIHAQKKKEFIFLKRDTFMEQNSSGKKPTLNLNEDILLPKIDFKKNKSCTRF